VYKANDNVALKYARSDSDEEIQDNFARENFVYEIFEKHEWASPYILQSLFRGTDAVSTLYMAEGRWTKESEPTRNLTGGRCSECCVLSLGPRCNSGA
jgi:hypothetical protein